jgi:ABC-type transport system involved in cytochrome bd biosynthesis fused ATPase/permease subunit
MNISSVGKAKDKTLTKFNFCPKKNINLHATNAMAHYTMQTCIALTTYLSIYLSICIYVYTCMYKCMYVLMYICTYKCIYDKNESIYFVLQIK